MTPRQYRNALKRLGLNQVEAAKVLGVSAPTSRRYAAIDGEIPEPVSKLLRLWIEMGTQRSRNDRGRESSAANSLEGVAGAPSIITPALPA